MLSHPMTRARRLLLTAAAMVAASVAFVACGSRGGTVAPQYQSAAHLFVQRCSGCHTLNIAGTMGSATNVRTREYKDGPNFDQRIETYNCVMYAIRNGGFSSGPMPQNIVTGPSAQAIARFISHYAGDKRVVPKSPTKPQANCPPPGG
jgi:mono/diheme cytochrome c family protein